MGMRPAEALSIVGSAAAVLLGGFYGGYTVGIGFATALFFASIVALLWRGSAKPQETPSFQGDSLAAEPRARRPVPALSESGKRREIAPFEFVPVAPSPPIGRDEPRNPRRFSYQDKLALAGPILKDLDRSRRTRGACGNCGAVLTLSARRPVKARCPRCGNAKVLT